MMQTLLDLISQRMTHFDASKRPYVVQSFAMSLDGKIATYTGDSKYISGDESRELVHHLRNLCDAILVGINTVRIDHPKLTTRLSNQQGKDAHRVILDSRGTIDINEPLIHQSSPAKTIICYLSMDGDKQNYLSSLGVILIQCREKKGHIDLVDALQQLHQWGIRSLLVEGGSDVHFSFLEAHLVDYMVITMAPIIIGGKTAKPAVGGQGFATLNEAVHLSHLENFMCGKDLIVHGEIFTTHIDPQP